MLPEFSRGRAGERPEHTGKIVIIADTNRLCHCRDRQIALQQQGLRRPNPTLGNQEGQGMSAGEFLSQTAELGAANAKLGGDRSQRQLFGIVLV